MNAHHHRFRIFDPQKQRKQARPARYLAGGDLAKFLDVRSGHEGTASTDQHCRFDGIIFSHLFHGTRYSLSYGRAQRIHRGIIDRNDCDLVVSSELNDVIHTNIHLRKHLSLLHQFLLGSQLARAILFA